MKMHPVSRFFEVSVKLPVEDAVALATALNGASISTRRVREIRRDLNLALRPVRRLERLARQGAASQK